VADKLTVPAANTLAVVALRLTLVTAAGLVTLTVQVPFFILSLVEVAVMTAVPIPTAVTKPVELTVATEVLLDDQVTFL
jgi:hypothetical protein